MGQAREQAGMINFDGGAAEPRPRNPRTFRPIRFSRSTAADPHATGTPTVESQRTGRASNARSPFADDRALGILGQGVSRELPSRLHALWWMTMEMRCRDHATGISSVHEKQGPSTIG